MGRSVRVPALLRLAQAGRTLRWGGWRCAPSATPAAWRGRGRCCWLAAVDGTGSQVVRYHGRAVSARYSSSSGGITQSNRVRGSRPLPYLPVQADPWDCGGRPPACRNPNWRWLAQRSRAAVSAALAPFGVGTVTGIRVTWRDSAGRVRTARVSGTRGSAVVRGGTLLRLLHLKSTRFTVAATR